MGVLDKIKGLLRSHPDQAGSGIDKAGDAVDDKTDGKYAKHVDTGQRKAEDFIARNPDDD